MYDPWTRTKVGECWWEAVTLWRGIKGRKKWDNSNSIMNKIYLKNIIPHDQVSSIPGMKGWYICKSINVIHQINKMEDKNHIIMSTDAEEEFDKTQYTLMMKMLSKVGMEVT